MTGKYIKLHAEIVNGKCPTCHELTILVGLTPELFRCISCGADLEQYINGVIKYIPALSQDTLKSKVDEYFDGKKV